jgi:hypothetical protein
MLTEIIKITIAIAIAGVTLAVITRKTEADCPV